MNWTPFNDDHTKVGIEGKYAVKNDTLVVFVEATNSKEDWFSDFFAPPVPLDFGHLKMGLCHAGYKNYAWWLSGMLYSLIDVNRIKKLKLFGYSMGGGVVQEVGVITDDYFDGVETFVYSIDGPRTTTVLPKNIRVLRNDYSLIADIPFWFRQGAETVLSTKKRPFWKAHADYNIDKIIKEYT